MRSQPALGRFAGLEQAAFEKFGTIPRRSCPDVFFVWDIFVARGFFAALQKLGVKIPEDVSVVVQTNPGLGLPAPFPVTRFKADGESVGAMVAGFVLSILQKGRIPKVPTIGRTYVIGGTFPR